MSSAQKQWISRLPSIAKYPGKRRILTKIFLVFCSELYFQIYHYTMIQSGEFCPENLFLIFQVKTFVEWDSAKLPKWIFLKWLIAYSSYKSILILFSKVLIRCLILLLWRSSQTFKTKLNTNPLGLNQCKLVLSERD